MHDSIHSIIYMHIQWSKSDVIVLYQTLKSIHAHIEQALEFAKFFTRQLRWALVPCPWDILWVPPPIPPPCTEYAGDDTSEMNISLMDWITKRSIAVVCDIPSAFDSFVFVVPELSQAHSQFCVQCLQFHLNDFSPWRHSSMSVGAMSGSPSGIYGQGCMQSVYIEKGYLLKYNSSCSLLCWQTWHRVFFFSEVHCHFFSMVTATNNQSWCQLLAHAGWVIPDLLL